MAIFHKFFDVGVDDPNTDIVRPSNWNEDHNSPAWLIMVWQEATERTLPQTPGQTWSNMPAALTKFMGDNRTYTIADLRKAVQARLIVEINAPGASGAEIRGQYSTDGGVNFNYLCDNSGPKQSIAANGIFAGAWYNVVPGAKIENCMLRLAGINGNAVMDPRFISVWLQVK